MLINNNGLKFYYNNDPEQQFRNSSHDVWNIEYLPPTRKENSFISECVKSAKSFTGIGPCAVLFSGGIDSEVVVRSFVETKQPFDVVIGKYNGLNDHDIEYAFNCCEELKIIPTVININLEELWENELNYYSNLSQTFSPQLCTYMHLASQIKDKIIIIGGGENHIVKKDNVWCISEKERISGLHRFFIKSKINGNGGFFQSTPELLLSGLTDIHLTKYLNDTSYIDSKEFKNKFYNDTWGIKFRPKYTGFEKVQDLDYKYRSSLKVNPLFGDQFIYTPITNIIDQEV